MKTLGLKSLPPPHSKTPLYPLSFSFIFLSQAQSATTNIKFAKQLKHGSQTIFPRFDVISLKCLWHLPLPDYLFFSTCSQTALVSFRLGLGKHLVHV